MRKTLIAIIAALTALSMALPAAAEKPAWAGPGLDTTIVGQVQVEDGEFDVLEAAVIEAGLVGLLNGEDDYTVFAPTDQAFVDLFSSLLGAPVDEAAVIGALEALGDGVVVPTVIGPVDIDTVGAILAYHVTDGVRNSNSVTKAKQVTMLDGNTISALSGSVEAVGSTADFALDMHGNPIIDIRVANGMIHVIDTVLLPF